MPFAGYRDFSDCVRKNQGKVKDANAYCAVIKKKTEEKQHEYDNMDACMMANKNMPDAKAYCNRMMKQKSMKKMMPEESMPISLVFNSTFETFNPETKEAFAEFLVRGVAIEECTSRNGITYVAKELQKSAGSMINKPILKDHENKIDSIVGKVINSKYDENKKAILYEGKIVDEKTKEMIKQGVINHVSIGATVQNLREETLNESKTVIAEGIEILELSLTPVPGIPNATITQAIAEAFELQKNKEIKNEVEKVEEIEVLKEEFKKLQEEKAALENKMLVEKKEVFVNKILALNNSFRKEELMQKTDAELSLIEKYETAFAKREESVKTKVETAQKVEENKVIKVFGDDDRAVCEAKAGDFVIGPNFCYKMPKYN